MAEIISNGAGWPLWYLSVLCSQPDWKLALISVQGLVPSDKGDSVGKKRGESLQSNLAKADLPSSIKEQSNDVPRMTASWTRSISFINMSRVSVGIPSNSTFQNARSAASNSSGNQNFPPVYSPARL